MTSQEDVEKFLEFYENINTTDDELRLLRLTRRYREALDKTQKICAVNMPNSGWGMYSDINRISHESLKALQFSGLSEEGE